VIFQEKNKIRSLYFLWVASTAAWYPMINLYFEKIGFKGVQIGVLASIIPVAMIVGQPFVNLLADKYGRRLVLTLVLISTAMSILVLLMKGSFVFSFICMSALALSYAPITPLVDSEVLEFVEGSPGSSYSQMRMWGSLGWMTCSFFTGYIVTGRSLNLIFIIGSALMVASALVSWSIKSRPNPSCEAEIRFEEIKNVISDPKVLLFLVILMFYGIGTAPINTFYSIYLNKIGAPPKLIGLSFTIQALSELPFLFIASMLVSRFGSLKVIFVSLLVSGIRIIFYTKIMNPYIAICFDATNGICYSLFLVGAIEYINEIVPARLRATGQSLIWASYSGVGLITGNLLTGYIYQETNIQGAFLFDGIILVAIAVLPLFIQRRYRIKTVEAI
jgi:PPP family 3-phenylpropionic acid transporter